MIIQKEEATHLNNELGRSKLNDDCLGTGNNPQEWLNLSLGSDVASTTEDTKTPSGPSSGKVYSCNFCRRKFFRSQALGGHQNAHKRERGAARRFQSQRMMAMMGMHINSPMVRSLGVRAHGLASKPLRNGTEVVARLIDANMGYGMAWMPLRLEDVSNLKWPGSFKLDSQQESQPEPQALDLNLRL